MLVLSRQLDESIMIGDDVVITIVDIRGDKVRLGIAAPTSIPVHRQEVYESIQRENMQAAYSESHPAADAARPVKPLLVRPRSFGQDKKQS
jgi:carbon storage regulator